MRNREFIPLIKLRVIPPLDKEFIPAVLWNRAFLNAVFSSEEKMPLTIALEGNDEVVSIFRTHIFPLAHKLSSENLFYIERLVKTLLWIHGGNKIMIEGPDEISEIRDYIIKMGLYLTDEDSG